MSAVHLLSSLAGPWAIVPDHLTSLAHDMPGLEAAEHALEEGQATPNSPYSVDDGVAIVPVQGTLSKRGLRFSGFTLLTSMREVGAVLRQAADDADVHAIMLDVESPGGTVDGIEELASAVLAAGQSKPLYAYADGLMASAAYWASCGARSIAASATAQVGSIGVVLMHREFSRALERGGVTFNVITAGRFKAAGNAVEPLSAEMRAYIQSGVDDVYEMFLAAVEKGRGMEREAVLAMADGKIFLAEAARKAGLIDRVCSRSDFLKTIKEEAAMPMTLANLKAQHPEAVDQLRGELRAALSAEMSDAHARALEAARADTTAERERIVALAATVFGKDAGEKLRTVAASGVSAEVLESLRGVFGAQADGQNAQQKMLDALKDATAKLPASAMEAVAGGSAHADFDALVNAHQQQHQCSRGEAIAAVAKAHPDAHHQWIAAANAAKR